MSTLKEMTDSEIIQINGTTNMYFLSQDKNVKGIIFHYSAGTSSKRGGGRSLISWFNQEQAVASADFAVDDEETVQYNGKLKRQACWACGDGNYYDTNGASMYGKLANMNTINVEMVSNNKTGEITYPNDPNYYFTAATLNRSIRLARYLVKKFDLDYDHIYRHYDVSGKPCPGVIGWNEESGDDSKWKHFKWCVKNNKSWDEKETSTTTTNAGKTVYAVQVGAFEIESNADNLVTELRSKGYSDAYKVKKTV